MKKLLIIVTLMAFMCGGAFAQSNTSFGGKFGLGMAKQNISGTDAKMGINGGLFVNIKIGSSFSIQPELLYTQKGLKLEALGLSVDWNLNYIEIPILMKKTFQTSGSMKPNLYVGPAIGILVSADLLGVDIKDLYKSTDIGIAVGGGFDIAMGESGLLIFDLRGTLGLTDIADIPGSDSMKNLNITFMMGYGFGGGGN